MKKTRQVRVRRRKRVGARQAGFAVAPLGLFVLFAALPTRPPEPTSPPPISVKPRILYDSGSSVALPAHPLCLRVDRGDTLQSVFATAGLESDQAGQLAADFGQWADLRRLQPGHVVRFARNDSGSIQSVRLRIQGWGDVLGSRDADGRFMVQGRRDPERSVESVITAPVQSSLYEALEDLGEKPQLAAQLSHIFQWDVDLFRLQEGDWFTLIVDRRFVGEDLVGYGPIRAARFRVDGQTYEAFRFEWPDGTAGYYTRDGRPLRKQFLKAPLKFTRITSGFSHRRFHPILRRFRPHYGVDYGAPVGTPVLSTADGVVVAAGYDRGEGNFIRIRHNSRIETSYLHLARFAKGIKKGARVRQSQVIGFVGQTGLTTGPHLDYRVTDRGRPVNPLQLKSISLDPLYGISLRRFRVAVAGYTPRLSSEAARLARRAEGDIAALF